MKICSECFSDPELRGFVDSFNTNGVCDFCASEGNIIDIEELIDFFQDLISCFKPEKSTYTLSGILCGDWELFSSFDTSHKILGYLITRLDTEIRSPNDAISYIDDIIENYSHWNEIKDSLKWSRRFISDINNLEDFEWDGFFNTQFQLTSSDIQYRGRVHHESGKPAYEPSEMKCPKKEITKGGRANPMGIPYLYLCDNPDTVLYEIRASYLDEVSIGKFSVLESRSPIKIVDFTEKTSLFQPNEDVDKIIKAKLLRDLISNDLSKPMRRYDSEIEYIPTQFICEFILVITGAMGIRFQSSLHPEGKNIVIFDQDLMECTEVSLKRVNTLNLSASNV